MNKTHRLLCAVIVLLVTSCQQEKVKTVASPVRVKLQTIEQSVLKKRLIYSGTVEAENTAHVGFSVPGVVNNIFVQEGQSVKKGQLLATVDDTEYQNALAIANASKEQAEDMYSRLNSLYEKGSLPAKDFIDIKTKVAQAKANQSINAKRIKDSKLTAPFSGIITAKLIERGSTAAPGVTAFDIVKTEKVFARIAVPESEVGVLFKGMAAGVIIPTLRDTLSGEVTIINPQADEVSKTYIVKIKLDNAKGRILPGMLTTVTIESSKPEAAIIIPSTAVVRDADDITYVFVSSDEKKAVRKRVEVQGIAGNNQVIIAGLKNGEQVVIAGQSQLHDGSAISF